MAFAPNAIPAYAVGPLEVVPVALPAAAKTTMTDTTNAVQVLPLTGTVASGRKLAVQKLVVRSVASLSSGRMMAFLYNGTTAIFAKDIAHPSTTVSTTAGAADIDFGFTDADALIIPEGYALYVGSAVAQASGAAVIAGRGKTF